MGAEGGSEQAYEPLMLNDGPFKGWFTWSGGSDPFESSIGPFCFRDEADGRVRAAFMPGYNHLNGGGAIHGGCLMSFADFSLFAIARRALTNSNAVTVTFNSEFISAGAPDVMVEASGEVLRVTKSLVFVRGLISQTDRTLLAFSGTLKKIA